MICGNAEPIHSCISNSSYGLQLYIKNFVSTLNYIPNILKLLCEKLNY